MNKFIVVLALFSAGCAFSQSSMPLPGCQTAAICSQFAVPSIKFPNGSVQSTAANGSADTNSRFASVGVSTDALQSEILTIAGSSLTVDGGSVTITYGLAAGSIVSNGPTILQGYLLTNTGLSAAGFYQTSLFDGVTSDACNGSALFTNSGVASSCFFSAAGGGNPLMELHGDSAAQNVQVCIGDCNSSPTYNDLRITIDEITGSYNFHADNNGGAAVINAPDGSGIQNLNPSYLNWTLGTPPPNDAALCLASGVLGHCTTAVGSDGTCTCSAP